MANIVAIVGRPNVGKSTLFNRLVEDRKAIVGDLSGITRDRHYGYAEWGGIHFTIVDTGGYLEDDTEVFAQDIREQIRLSLLEASVILFVVDCKDGLVGLDKDFANILRCTKKPIILVANKADDVTREWMVGEFYALGVSQIYPIAAISGYGTGDLLDALIEHLKGGDAEQKDGTPRLAVIGKPNVGKSSFINALLQEQRNIVSPLSGTTRDSIDSTYNKYGNNIILTDTAGIRRKSKVKDNIEFYSVMRAIGALQNSDVCLLIIDAQEGIAAQDINLVYLAHRYRKGIAILVNKWDLVERGTNTAADYRKEILSRLQPFNDIPVLFTSATKKQRIFQAIKLVMHIYEIRSKRIPTSKLNDVMLKAIQKYPPPAIKGKYIKIKYVTQLPTDTPIFAFFCNLPQYIKIQYKLYLENQMRKNFDLKGVPIKLVFRKK